jgi:heat shock protein HtpX
VARQRRLNRLHSALILLSLAGLAGWTGLLVGGAEGLSLGGGMALAFLVLDPMPGDLLFRHAFGTVRLAPAQAPELFAVLATLAWRAGLPRPPLLCVIPSPTLQAMAAGGWEAPAVAVTSELLRILSRRELAAVLAQYIGQRAVHRPSSATPQALAASRSSWSSEASGSARRCASSR